MKTLNALDNSFDLDSYSLVHKKCIRSSLSVFLTKHIYIYIYIYWQHFFINTNFVKHNRHFLFAYFLVDPFILLYYNTAIWKDQQENMLTENVYYVQRNLYIYIYIYIYPAIHHNCEGLTDRWQVRFQSLIVHFNCEKVVSIHLIGGDSHEF